MNELIKRVTAQIVALWTKWTLVQKIILIGIVVVVAGGITALVSLSSAPAMVPVIDAPIRDEAVRDRIVIRINDEGVKTSVNAAGVVQVPDAASARRMRTILMSEGLLPRDTDPWAVFDMERWTTTDMEREVRLQRALANAVTDHIRALDDVDDADVTIVQPKKELFAQDQNPATASVIITPKPGSDIVTNRRKIEGIQRILKFAVQGLRDEFIVITDTSGVQLNDWEGMAAMDRLSRVEREIKIVQTREAKYRALVIKSLQDTFTADRVRELNVTIEMDMSPRTVNTQEYFPVTIKPRTPGLAYDDSEIVESITRSEAGSTTSWKGTGFVPEGPAGTEGQMPPAYRDLQNVYGQVAQETTQKNYEINQRTIQEERSPRIDRITVSVNIDGTWKRRLNEKREPVITEEGEIGRDYTPLSAEEKADAESLIRDAIGYSAARGDSVTVTNIRYDRSAQFAGEDAAYFRQRQMQLTILIFMGGLLLLAIGFVAFRVISREMERRRRLREEEISRQQQALRESALLEAEEGVEVSMSVEERRRMELQENAINMAKEHPGDVAQLIRTWLLEE